MGKDQNSGIIAFDILPMSSTERHGGVRVAASAKFSDGKTKDWSELSRRKLIDLVDKYKFKYLGTDNPSEIISSDESLAAFCDQLPTECSLVHVNLTRNGVTIPLQSLIYQNDIDTSRKKLSPVKTARAIVKLIEQGVGMILEPYESETLIKVGRPSSSSKGGWSQARYQRQAEEVVAREAKKIKSILDREKLPYDEIIHSTKYGAKMARFHVFKSRGKIDDVFSQISFYPANVKIWSPKKDMITHKPLRTHKKPTRSQLYSHLRRLIIGIDPGMTTGVAIMNLQGRIQHVFSRKNLSKGQLVSEIANYGVPVLVCADVTPVPTFVSKFASTYNAKVYAPDIELSKEDKRYLANKMNISHRIDSHERDAVSAVVHAYQKLEENFDKIEATKLSRKEKNLAKGLLIQGLSVKDSISSVKLLQNRKTSIDGIEEDKDYHERDLELIGRVSNLLEEMAHSEDIISNLRAHGGRLEAKNHILQEEIKSLRNKIENLRDEQTRKVLKSTIVEEKDRQLNNMRRKLAEIQKEQKIDQQRIDELEEMLWVSIEKGGLPVKILPKFSHDAINELRQNNGIEDGDIILILDPTGGGPQTAENLAKNKLEFVFTEGYQMPNQAFEVLYKEGIPVLRAEKYSILRSNYLGLINKSNLLQAKEDYNQYVTKRKEKEKTSSIFKTINDYKYQRAKELQDNIKTYDDYELDEDAFTSES